MAGRDWAADSTPRSPVCAGPRQSGPATSLAGTADLLERMHGLVGRHAQAWVETAAGIKGLPADIAAGRRGVDLRPVRRCSPRSRTLARSVAALEEGGSPVDGYRLGSAPGGRVTVEVLPHNVYDRLLLSGFSAQVWMQPGVSADDRRAARPASAERNPAATNGVGVVLGAGNITSIAPLDVLYELYANNRVVALKLNPIMDALLPVYRDVFAPLIDLGVLGIVTGGGRRRRLPGAPRPGRPRAHHRQRGHPRRDRVGHGRGGAQPAGRTDDPLLTKPITSELGGVSPIIVLPGTWSKADLRFQAEHVATHAPAQRRLQLHRRPGRRAVRGLAAEGRVPRRAPGRAATGRRPAGRTTRAATAGWPTPARPTRTPRPVGGRVLVSRRRRPDLPAAERVLRPGARRHRAARQGDFLSAAVRTANDDFAGTLGVNLIAHPAHASSIWARPSRRRSPTCATACIAVNAWTAVGFLTAAASWGAFPGHTLDDVQSGIGVVHNALLLSVRSGPSSAGRSGRCRARWCTASSRSPPSRRGSSPTARRPPPAGR